MKPGSSATAVTFAAPRRVELRPVTVDGPGPGQVLVRTAYSGISSGTEMLAYRGELPADAELDDTISALSGTFRYPFRYGYSCVGRVEQSEAVVPAGALVFAFHPHQDVFVADATDVIVLDDVDAHVATLFPLVETALQITLDAGPVFAQRVTVTGLGAVGLLTALLLQEAGADVLAAEPTQWRRNFAADLGVRTVHPADLAGSVKEATGGKGVPLHVEASGHPGALADSLGLLAHEGTALVASWYGTKPVPLPLGAEFHRRRLTVRSTQVSTIPSHLGNAWDVPRRRATAARLLRELPVASLATTEFDFAEAPSAYSAVDRGEPGLIHAALRYR